MPQYRWIDLEPHPDSQVKAVKRICVGYDLRTEDWHLAFEVYGDIAQLELPPVHSVKLGQDLWQSSCFEMFIACTTHSYRELNFAPDGRCAAADFAGYRRAPTWLRDPVLAHAESWQDAQRYRIDLSLAGTARPDMANHVGLCAIICDKSGAKSWWALQHEAGEPDFHHVSSFLIPLT